MTDNQLNITEIDERIAAVRDNLRKLVEQAAVDTGDSVEEFISRRISQQEAQLEALMKQRDDLSRRKS
jgi:CO dehydrogenase/acetyl-CoA synthase epsilon subunit